jgi:hypothetical protein
VDPGACHIDRHIETPPEEASPSVVVRAYLDALDVHDCETADALWVKVDPDVTYSGRMTCHDIESVRGIDVATTHPAPDAVETYVPVHLDIRGRWWSGDVPPEGPEEFGYFVTRDSPSAPWRIAGGGVG